MKVSWFKLTILFAFTALLAPPSVFAEDDPGDIINQLNEDEFAELAIASEDEEEAAGEEAGGEDAGGDSAGGDSAGGDSTTGGDSASAGTGNTQRRARRRANRGRRGNRARRSRGMSPAARRRAARQRARNSGIVTLSTNKPATVTINGTSKGRLRPGTDRNFVLPIREVHRIEISRRGVKRRRRVNIRRGMERRRIQVRFPR